MNANFEINSFILEVPLTQNDKNVYNTLIMGSFPGRAAYPPTTITYIPDKVNKSMIHRYNTCIRYDPYPIRQTCMITITTPQVKFTFLSF